MQRLQKGEAGMELVCSLGPEGAPLEFNFLLDPQLLRSCIIALISSTREFLSKVNGVAVGRQSTLNRHIQYTDTDVAHR